MKFKWLFSSIAVTLLLAVALLGLAQHNSALAAQEGAGKIEDLLLERFTADGTADFIVRFTEQADLSPAYSMDWDRAGRIRLQYPARDGCQQPGKCKSPPGWAWSNLPDLYRRERSVRGWWHTGSCE